MTSFLKNVFLGALKPLARIIIVCCLFFGLYFLGQKFIVSVEEHGVVSEFQETTAQATEVSLPERAIPQETVSLQEETPVSVATESTSRGQYVEINGDIMEYSIEQNKVIAQGNVLIVHKEGTLSCDRIEFFRDTNIGNAYGNVRLTTSYGAISGDQMVFNFQTMKGDFEKADYVSRPLYGRAEKISKVAENKIVLTRGYMTTCDLEKPHFRFTSKAMEVYPQDKMVARHARFMLGEFPLLYLPKFTQDISGKEPFVILTPGYDKQWGMYVLSAWRYKLNEHVKGFLRLDAREKKDIAEGFDVKYDIPGYGQGLVRTYYMNERNIQAKRWYAQRIGQTIERDRFKGEWRHQWQIDPKTNVILQYYRWSDASFLREYFEREFKKDSSPDTYLLLTKSTGAGTLSFRTDKRVNRFESGTERLPELSYDLSDQEILDTNLYFRSTTTYSNLSSKEASPTEVRKETQRVNFDSEVSYPFKLSFIELKPFVGGRETYYSKTKDPSSYNSLRGQFRTGATLSTKFYKLMEIDTNFLAMDIHRLRHIITPTVSYSYDHDPTIPSDKFDSYDAFDSLQRKHIINFGFENKWQTKRDKTTIDLLRVGIKSDFRLKEDPGLGGFDKVNSTIEFKPNDKVNFLFDSMYDSKDHTMKTANFDLYLNQGSDKWAWNISKRWIKAESDQVTSEFSYKINPKWRFRVYSLFDLWNGGLKEQEYGVVRDLHCWEMEINFNETRGQGDEVWIIFRLKAFPEMLLDLGTSFNKRKTGSQISGSP